jgi:ABC-2 type transport system ATP-binding protein
MEEAERLCDALAIIDHGKLIAQGTVKELKAQLGTRDALQLHGSFPDGVRAVEGLEIIGEDAGSLTLALPNASQHLPTIFQAIASAGGSVAETSLRSPNLETLFLLLTGKELRE